MAKFPQVFVALLAVFTIASLAVVRGDEDPLQDVCVQDPNSKVFINGVPCKDPTTVTADDFTSTILREPANTTNTLNIRVQLIDITMFPGLNTQGLSIARLSFGPFGVNPPHVHPRSSEVIYCLQGRIYAGFVTTANRLFEKVLYPGDLFIFPRGLVHFQRNLDPVSALAIATLGSQNPGRTDVARALFQTQESDNLNEVIEAALQVDEEVIEKLRAGVSQT
ncbi:putative germin-like protein 8-1 [Selaginella moellendorffii]|uniref:putative germin-like protein 8-1 n=1 Tax=Selaginella moellendorffii TaxID=88036 RepID=UPI000D1C389E|nr:putative germin-like protein 8-1 [Selaginella moellendorffii]XP_024542627.1 putative germin-like protein 8-1 [Selaginella moellendorffii]|eukprot:XP_024523513.1 putative germin-like protein 8-1 [Selaginella moellendorffii]